MTFKDRLRELRAAAGLTQQQLAERAGLPVGSVRNHEQGQRLPSWAAVVKLSKALGVPTDSFADCDEVFAEMADGKPGAKPPAKPKKPPAAAKPKPRPRKGTA